MKQYVGTVGPKGQVTLPMEIRKQLGIEPRDKVAIEVEAGTAVVRRIQSSLLEGYGSIHALIPGMSDKEVDLMVERDAVRDALQEDSSD